jgi:hypothetical protein
MPGGQFVRYRRFMPRRLLLLLALLLAGCFCSDPAPDQGRREFRGLSASLPVVAPGSNGQVALDLSLEWLNEGKVRIEPDGSMVGDDVWLLEADEPAVVTLWTASGDQAGQVVRRFVLPEEFRRRGVRSMVVPLVVSVPANAESISVSLGASGLETGRVHIPRTE